MTARSNHLRVLAAIALPATVAIVCLLAFATGPANATGTQTIQIPLRWCALNGTTAATNTNSILLQRQARAASQIWIPGANITFRSPFTAAIPPSSANFPVISDPRPPVSSPANPNETGLGPGQVGDILDPDSRAAAAELHEARAECEEEWDKFALPPPGGFGTKLQGPIALNIRRFVDNNGSPVARLGQGEPPTSYGATRIPAEEPIPPSEANETEDADEPGDSDGPGDTEDAEPDPRCETPPDRLTGVGEDGFIGVVDFSFVQDPALDARIVAHEIGHVLYLGHGNGRDDDGDIKYDNFCDPGNPPGGEDGLNSPATIMHPFTSGVTTNVTTLQRGTSRGIARVTPGSQIDPPFELVNADTLSDHRVDDAHDVKGASVDMTGVGMTINAKQEQVILSHTLFGLVSKDESTKYAAFLDLDSDQTTGGRPAELGFPTRFKGAELVTRVRVQGGPSEGVHPIQLSEARPATPTVWRVDGGRFVDVTKRGVTATVSSPVGEEMPFPTFDVVSAQLPADVVGHVGSRVRFQAITVGKGKDWVDVLPGERVSRRVPAGSVDLFMTPPRFPACTTIPEVAQQPGDAVTIKAAGFDRQGEEVHVMLDGEPIAKAELDRTGNMSTDVAIQEETMGGLHLITIQVEDSALTADCALQVRGGGGGMASPTAATALRDTGGPPVPLLLALAGAVLLVAFGVIALSVGFRNP